VEEEGTVVPLFLLHPRSSGAILLRRLDPLLQLRLAANEPGQVPVLLAGQVGPHVRVLLRHVIPLAGVVPEVEQQGRVVLDRRVHGAGDLAGHARSYEARALLAKTLTLRGRIGHPGLALTEQLLKAVGR
jgi:hypothetical protein